MYFRKIIIEPDIEIIRVKLNIWLFLVDEIPSHNHILRVKRVTFVFIRLLRRTEQIKRTCFDTYIQRKTESINIYDKIIIDGSSLSWYVVIKCAIDLVDKDSCDPTKYTTRRRTAVENVCDDNMDIAMEHTGDIFIIIHNDV